MIGGSLRTLEALRDQRFPEIRQAEKRNPTIRRFDYYRLGR
jgi:hypothetical protein